MIPRPGVPGLGAVLSAPFRVASAGLHVAVTTTAAAAGLAGSAALVGGSAATRAGEAVLDVVPGARTAARAVTGMAIEAVGGPPARRSSRHGRRRWIEVRGLSGPDADTIADAVPESVRGVPGVIDAVINRSVARVVITVDPEGPQQNLAAVVADDIIDAAKLIAGETLSGRLSGSVTAYRFDERDWQLDRRPDVVYDFMAINPTTITLGNEEIPVGKEALFFRGTYTDISDDSSTIEAVTDGISLRYTGDLEVGHVLARPMPESPAGNGNGTAEPPAPGAQPPTTAR